MGQAKGLSSQAFEPVPEGQAYEPYIAAGESPAEFTIKAVIPGIIFGILFGAANAYLGLQAGLTISTSIPVAVMTVAAFRALRSVGVHGTLLEANVSQTIGSASSSVASGVIFTLPALFMWGVAPDLLQMTLLGMCGGLLGVLFMIPLRRFLIEREHGKLPYPEGAACAEVLVASEVGGAKATNVFLGLAAGGLFRVVIDWLKLFPKTVSVTLHNRLNLGLGMKMSAALFGVGYILGPRIAAVMVGGGLLSSLIIIPAITLWGADRTEPLFPATDAAISQMNASSIWTNYVRYIGAGAVAAAGLITLIRSIPTMVESFRIGTRQLRERLGDASTTVPRTGLDLSLKVVGVGLAIIAAVMAFVPFVFGGIDTLAVRAVAAVCVVVFAFFFVTVSSRIVGLVGVTSNPTSGMTIASLIGTSVAFHLLGWTGMGGQVAALTVGCVVAIAASIAGDTSQDLKTGYLIGATPRKQQIGELIGVLTSATFVCLTLTLLAKAYGFAGQPGADAETALAAPQANLMKIVIEGVLNAELPWALVGIGAAIAAVAALVRIPALPFAVGVYLPVSTMVPVFLGGLLRWWLERRAASPEERSERRERGVLFGSGLVGGEGLLGVAIAGVVVAQSVGAKPGDKLPLPGEVGYTWAERLAEWAGVGGSAAQGAPDLFAAAFFILLIWAFGRRCRVGID
ncbi:MAG: oligopeptide transporter, OPT family [bacterium]|nr:oligopeptide transporter, OPT family [bacterium]